MPTTYELSHNALSSMCRSVIALVYVICDQSVPSENAALDTDTFVLAFQDEHQRLHTAAFPSRNYPHHHVGTTGSGQGGLNSPEPADHSSEILVAWSQVKGQPEVADFAST